MCEEDKYEQYDWWQVLHVLGLLHPMRLKQSGVLVGLCPFHNEKTPSIHFWLKSKRFKCHGCGEGGSIVDFVILYNNISPHPDIRKEELENFFAKISGPYANNRAVPVKMKGFAK